MKKLITFILAILTINVSAQQYLLIGTDTRDPKQKGNADLIMILTVRKKAIKLTSIMRDTYVFIPGHGNKKINAAYALGGKDLLMKTLNSNFKTKLFNSIAVDFASSAALVDCLNGITLSIDSALMNHMNNYIREQAYLKKTVPLTVNNTGDMILSGDQVLAYTRVRAKGGYDDYARVIRQRQVLMLIIKKIASDKSKALTCFGSIWNTFDTDIDFSSFANTFKAMAGKGNTWPQSASFPDNNYSSNQSIKGVGSVLKIKNLKTAAIKLNQLIQ